jgi:hypothetical protein
MQLYYLVREHLAPLACEKKSLSKVFREWTQINKFSWRKEEKSEKIFKDGSLPNEIGLGKSLQKTEDNFQEAEVKMRSQKRQIFPRV